jgi:hypothetical protein
MPNKSSLRRNARYQLVSRTLRRHLRSCESRFLSSIFKSLSSSDLQAIASSKRPRIHSRSNRRPALPKVLPARTDTAITPQRQSFRHGNPIVTITINVIARASRVPAEEIRPTDRNADSRTSRIGIQSGTPSEGGVLVISVGCAVEVELPRDSIAPKRTACCLREAGQVRELNGVVAFRALRTC